MDPSDNVAPLQQPQHPQLSCTPIAVSSALAVPHPHKKDAQGSLPLDGNDDDNNNNNNDKVYLPRLVTPHPFLPAQDQPPSQATVETMVEPAANGRYRVVIQSGPDHGRPTATKTSRRQSSSPLIHASFLLPEPTQFPYCPNPSEQQQVSYPSLLAWTHFDSTRSQNDGKERDTNNDNNKSTFLCVLVHPTLVSIHNVYPTNQDRWTVQQEGWTVPLPSECASIFAIPQTGGLLIQRLADASELDDVFLDAPPIPTAQQRHRPTTTTNNNNTLTTPLASDPTTPAFSVRSPPQAAHQLPNELNHVPALFTLTHYQQDVTPLAHSTLSSSTDQPQQQQHHASWGFWNDPLEQVLWVDHAYAYHDKDAPDHGKRSTILVVTHHARLQRHAIWSLEQAPPPPKPPTLARYYATQHNYHPNEDMNQNDTTRMDNVVDPALLWESTAPGREAEEDMMRMMNTSSSWEDPPSSSWSTARPPRTSLASRSEPLAAMGERGTQQPPQHPGSSTTNRYFHHHHQEALADALGVHARKPTRHTAAAVTNTASRGPHASFVSPTADPNSTNHPLLLSNGTHASSSTSSFLTSRIPTPRDGLAGSSSHNSRMNHHFFSTIHPHYVTRSLYQEHNKSSPIATPNVFLVTDLEATGLCLLVWMIPDEEEGLSGSPVPQTLHLFRTSWHFSSVSNSHHQHAMTRRIEPMNVSLSCLDAQPIQTTSLLLPQRCGAAVPTRRTRLATELLLVQSNSTLVLHRAHLPLTRLQVKSLPPSSSECRIVQLTDPVHHRVGLALMDSSQTLQQQQYRVSVELVLPCGMAEQALCAIQSSLERQQGALAALLFRTDCVRLYQELAQQAPTLTNLPFKALSAVVMTIVAWDLDTVSSSSPSSSLGRTESAKAASHSAWDALQSSEYGLGHDIFPLDDSSLDTMAGDKMNHAWAENVYVECGASFWSHLKQNRTQQQSVTKLLFDPLHLVLEDSKLSNRGGPPPEFVELLVRICTKSCNEIPTAFLQHYQYSASHIVLKYVKHLKETESMSLDSQGKQPSFTSFEEPPNILEWIEDVISSGPSSTSYFETLSPNDINPACSNIRFIKLTFSLLSGEKDVELVETLIREGFRDQQSICESFVPGIAFPLLSFLNKLTNDASTERVPLSPEGFALIGRNDLSFNMATFVDNVTSLDFSSPSSDAIGERPEGEEPYGSHTFSDEEKDGLVPLELRSSMLFPDNRIREAARLVRSSRPMFLRVPRVVEITDHEYEQLKQRKLALLVRRALALPIGRGMMTIGGLKPLAAESLPLPELSLKGRVPPTNGTLSLDQSECPTELKVWPDFHNGVAAGLRLPLRDDSGPENGDSQITRTWILYNKPPRIEIPTQPEDGTNNNNNAAAVSQTHAHGGFLLALGLRGHLTALEMTDIYEYLTQGTATVTVGVLLGMAANKRGSCDMSVSKMLCLHIPSLIPQYFSAIDVASAVQSAAVAGVGLLYQNSSHRMMTEFLLNEIGKRPESDTSALDRESYTLSCGIALGMVNLCIGGKDGQADRAAGISDLRVEERLRRFINGGQSSDEESRRIRESNDRFSIPSYTYGVETEKCSIIFEANMINTDITAPAATLAMGLMYMKSGNHTVAAAVSIPQTHFLLEFVRPDFLGLRVIARSLILWDEVEPSMSWIEKQVPKVVQSAYHSMRSVAQKAMEGRTPVKSQRSGDYDRRAIRQIYVNIIAGACFSMGLRYAGTGDERAKQALFECVLQIHKLREGNDPISVVSKPEFPILETSLGLCAISLAMVMAGTGDLDALRLFKSLRWRHDKDIVYGTHMIFGAATGLLFLGGGTMTLGREPEDIAALVAAFFPRFPTESMDNQYHLQALRHLYALAARKSDIWAIDIDSGEKVYVPVTTLASPEASPSLPMQVPCLLRNSEFPTRFLKVTSEDFYPMLLRLKDSGSSIFSVKRRRAPMPQIGDLNSTTKKTGTVDRDLLSQVKYLSLSPMDGPVLRKLLTGSHTKEQNPTILLFLSLMSGVRSLGNDTSASSLSAYVKLLWDLRLLRSFHLRHVVPDDKASEEHQTLRLEAELVAYLLEKAYQQLALLRPRSTDARKQVLSSILQS